MKLHDVLKTARRFKRKGDDFIYKVNVPDGCVFSPNQVLADDWEIIERKDDRKIEISASQVLEAVEIILNGDFGDKLRLPLGQELIEQLGFEK